MRFRNLSLIPAVAIVLGACVDRATAPAGVASPSLALSNVDVAVDGTRGYVAQRLPTLPGNGRSAALAINDAGIAVGFSDLDFRIDPPDHPRAACHKMVATIFDHGQARSLDAELFRAFGGDPCAMESMATAINDRGDVVGSVWWSDLDWGHSGFFWSEATGVILHAEIGSTSLMGVNGTGLVVGNFLFDGMTEQDFLWSPLGPPPPVVAPAFRWYYSWGVNDAGRRAGCVNRRVFTMDLDGTFRHLGERCQAPPSLLPYSRGEALNIGGAINAEGTVVFANGIAPRRWAANASRSTAVGWSPGGAAGISDPGRIVGWRSSASTPLSVAMTVGPRGQAVVLPSVSGMPETEAYAVNACGTIVGSAFETTSSPIYLRRTPHAVIWMREVCDTP